jgi:molybdenum cofactor biosynthesis enzyme MoaA
LEIEIHPAEFCNLQCGFCPTVGKKYEDDPHFAQFKERLPKGKDFVELINRMFNEIARAGAKRIIFSGGKEPTLAAHILDFVRGARGAGLQVKVTTNASGFSVPHQLAGTLISGEELTEFYASNLDRIHLSLNAHTRGLFNQIKGLAADSCLFDTIVSNVTKIAECRDALKEKGRHSVEIYAAVLVEKGNYAALPEIVDFLSGLGVDIISLNRYQHHMVGRQDGYSAEEHASILQTLSEIESKWKSTRTRLIISFEDFNDRYYKRILSTKARCWTTFSETAFNPVFAGFACDTAAFPGRSKIGQADYSMGFLLDHRSFKSYWISTVEKRKKVDSLNCTDCRLAHKLTNLYVDKIYNDLTNGVMLEDQPFYPARRREWNKSSRDLDAITCQQHT